MAAHGTVVWQTVYRIVGNDADAHDCFQETFIAAMKVAAKETIQNWGGLLRRVATQRAIDVLRRRKTDLLRKTFNDAEPGVSRTGEATRAALNSELGDRLKIALAQLPGAQAEVFCLRHLSDLSYDQIAEETGLSVDAVGVTLHRAKAKLRTLMANYADNPAPIHAQAGGAA